MGHRPPPQPVSPWLTMTAWGAARVAIPAAVLGWLGGEWWWLVGAGLLCAPIYEGVWHVPAWAYLRGFGYGDGAATGYDAPELAEAVHGAAMGAGLLLAVWGL